MRTCQTAERETNPLVGLRIVGLCVVLLSSSRAPAQGTPVPNLRTMVLRDDRIQAQLALNAWQRSQLDILLNAVELPLWRLRDQTPALRETQVLQTLGVLDRGLGRILTVNQRSAYEGLLVLQRAGASGSLPLRRRACRAPALQGITAWINAPPTTLAAQRGKVVILHFFTSDCINCVNNLPFYNQWYSDSDRNDVTVLGVHTPESPAEARVEHVRQTLGQHRVAYPVALDPNRLTWQAWANPVWPAVYLIDRSGFVRAWWYGELHFSGRAGDLWVRQRLAELLPESP